MAKLLAKAASPEILNAAWKRLHNDKAVWSNKMSRREMEKNLVYHMLKLSDELRTGKYRSDPVRFFPVSKGNGKQRIISAYNLRDKVAQRAVLTVIEPFGEEIFHHDSFGYRSGRTIDMVLARVREYMLCGLKWVVDADISSYFDNILHKPLLASLKDVVNDMEIIEITKWWLKAGTIKRSFLDRSRGIPQGAVISPFLCNIYLTAFDNALSNGNLPFVRFADDFLVFAETEKDALRAHIFVGKQLNKLGLELNPDKTRVAECGPRIEFLGRKLPNLKKKLRMIGKESLHCPN